jgi:uncharacterized protein (TIGR02646 family)
MIYVDRATVAQPAVLVGPTSKGAKERARAIELYRVKKNHQKKFTYSAYKAKEVTKALELLFRGKCAYCESDYLSVQPVDIEHYRPKGGIAVGRKLVKPGYYWLAAEWSNLFPSCIDCNRERTHLFPNIGAETAGKANKFPIAVEAKRAKAPGEESKERPLLLCPCEDQPEEHLEFDHQGNVKHTARSRKGKVSIEVYGLRRPGLVQARKAVALNVLACIKRLKWLEVQKRRYPRDKSFDSMIRAEKSRLKKFVEPASTYSGMSKQLINRYYGKL